MSVIGGILKDIMTCKDGESFDVVRVAMTIIILMIPFILMWGMSLYTWGYLNGKPFDMNGAFVAILEFITGVGTFLMSGAAALHFKRGTEPNTEAQPPAK